VSAGASIREVVPRAPVLAPDRRIVRPEPPVILVVAAEPSRLHRLREVLRVDGIAAAGHHGPVDELTFNGGGSPRLMILACDLADASGVADVRRLCKQRRAGRLVAVTPAVPGNDVRRALEAGVDGVVFDDDLEHALGVTARAVLTGQVAVPRMLRGALHPPALSHRQKQVVALAADGLTNAEIAERLYLTESTVKTHLSVAFEKLAVRSRREAAALLLDPDHGLSATLVAPLEPGSTEPAR
jgi:DNA-binding NarL/FixJ family response regulator